MKIFKILLILLMGSCFLSPIQAQNPTPTKTPEVVGEVTVSTTKANSDLLATKIENVKK